MAATSLGSFTISSATPLDRSVQLAWTAAPGATSYTVRYGTTSGTWGSVASTSATSPYTVTGLTAGVTYYFQVQAVNGNGSMYAGGGVGGEISAVPKAVPTNVIAHGGSDAVCSVLSNGDLKCWGRATYGMLGNGSEAFVGDDADEVIDNSQAAQLGTGRTVSQVFTNGTAFHACAILDNGSVKCWDETTLDNWAMATRSIVVISPTTLAIIYHG